MCKIKKMYVLLLPLSFLCVASFTSFASNLNLPDNFTGLSVQERIQWLDSNGSQVTEYGTLVGKQRDVLSNYESKKTNYYRNEIGSKAVGISVTYNWSVNPDGTIETYNVSDFSTIIYDSSYVFIDKSLNSFYVNPTNVKVYPEANFACAYLGVLVAQNVNLHGSGKISYEPIDSSFSR